MLQSPDTFTAPCMRRYFHYTGQSLVANRNNPVFQIYIYIYIYRNPSISMMWYRVISSNQGIEEGKGWPNNVRVVDRFKLNTDKPEK
jgi:hypothetical protein